MLLSQFEQHWWSWLVIDTMRYVPFFLETPDELLAFFSLNRSSVNLWRQRAIHRFPHAWGALMAMKGRLREVFEANERNIPRVDLSELTDPTERRKHQIYQASGACSWKLQAGRQPNGLSADARMWLAHQKCAFAELRRPESCLRLMDNAALAVEADIFDAYGYIQNIQRLLDSKSAAAAFAEKHGGMASTANGHGEDEWRRASKQPCEGNDLDKLCAEDYDAWEMALDTKELDSHTSASERFSHEALADFVKNIRKPAAAMERDEDTGEAGSDDGMVRAYSFELPQAELRKLSRRCKQELNKQRKTAIARLQGAEEVTPMATATSVLDGAPMTDEPGSSGAAMLDASSVSVGMSIEDAIRLDPPMQAQQACLLRYVCSIVQRTIEGGEVDQMLALVCGEPGVGKTTTILRIITWITSNKWLRFYRGGAYAGKPCTHFGAQTLHSLLHIMLNQSNDNDNTAAKLQSELRDVLFLIIDEASQIDLSLLGNVNDQLQTAKGNSLPFGGVHILMFTDFYQMPPPTGMPLFAGARFMVRTPRALLKSKGWDVHKVRALELFHLFKDVFIFTILDGEMSRMKDKHWHAFCQRLRYAYTNIPSTRRDAQIKADYEWLMKRVLGSPDGPQLSDPKWLDASVCSPRNLVNEPIGRFKLLEKARRDGVRACVYVARDREAGRDGRPLQPKLAAAVNRVSEKKVKCAREFIFVPGGRYYFTGGNGDAMPELNLANGSEGVGVRLLVDARDNSDDGRGEVRLLRYPPTVILKMDKPKHTALPGLNPGEILFPPIKHTFSVPMSFVHGGGRSIVKPVKVTRTGPSLLQCMTNTDYAVQGSNLSALVCDYRPAPFGKQMVAPTRSQVLIPATRVGAYDDFALLRPFPIDVLQQIAIDPDLNADMRRLHHLAEKTSARLRTRDADSSVNTTPPPPSAVDNAPSPSDCNNDAPSRDMEKVAKRLRSMDPTIRAEQLMQFAILAAQRRCRDLRTPSPPARQRNARHAADGAMGASPLWRPPAIGGVDTASTHASTHGGGDASDDGAAFQQALEESIAEAAQRTGSHAGAAAASASEQSANDMHGGSNWPRCSGDKGKSKQTHF